MNVRSPRASDIGARLLQALFAPLVVFSLLEAVTLAAPTSAPIIWSVVGDVGEYAVTDSSWVLPAMLALTAGLYALIIGDGLVGTDRGSEGLIRRAAGVVALCVASAVIFWMGVSVGGAAVRPHALPHLLGVLLLGSLTLTVAVLFGSFQFYSGRERLARASKAHVKLHGRRAAIPRSLVTRLPSWVPALIAAVLATSIGATGFVLVAGYPPVFAVIAAWVVPAILTPLLWWQSIEYRLDTPNRPWSGMSLLFGVYLVVSSGYLIVVSGFPTSIKGLLLTQVVLIAVSAAPVPLPSWVQPWTMNSGGATRAARVLERRLHKSRVLVVESLAEIPAEFGSAAV